MEDSSSPVFNSMISMQRHIQEMETQVSKTIDAMSAGDVSQMLQAQLEMNALTQLTMLCSNLMAEISHSLSATAKNLK